MKGYRPRVAFFSPLSPDRSGISAYSELILPLLAEAWDIHLFVEGYEPSDPLAASLPCFDCSRADPLPLLPDFDAVIYQIGNSPSHSYIYDTLMAWPGLVVLHELSIHHFVAGRTVATGRIDLYLKEVRSQLGDEEAEEARRAFFDSIPGPWESRPLEVPMNRRVLDQATGLLCHSEFVERAVHAIHPKLYVEVVQHPAWPHDRTESSSVAAEEEGERSTLRLVAAGNLTPNKSIYETVCAAAILSERFDVELRLVGNLELDFDVEILAEIEGLRERLQILGRVSDAVLMSEIEAADLSFCMRTPTLGESSGIVLRSLSVGTPVVVSDIGWFRELPDDVALKAPAPLANPEQLVELLTPLLEDARRREAMSRAALDFAANATPERTAAAYIDWVLQAGTFPNVMAGRALGLLSELARDLDIEDASNEALPRAELFRELLRYKPAARPDWLYPPAHLAPIARAETPPPSERSDSSAAPLEGSE